MPWRMRVPACAFVAERFCGCSYLHACIAAEVAESSNLLCRMQHALWLWLLDQGIEKSS